jgi:hypothetical protein
MKKRKQIDDDSTMPIRRSEWLETTDEHDLLVMHSARSTHTVKLLEESEHYRIIKREGSWRGDEKRQWLAGSLQLLETRAGGGNVTYYQRVGKPRRADRRWKSTFGELSIAMQDAECDWSRMNNQRARKLAQKATGEVLVEESDAEHRERRRQILLRLERATGLREVSIDAIEALLDLVETRQG